MTNLSANHYICPDDYGTTRFLDEAVSAGYRTVAITRAVLAELSVASLKAELAARELQVSTLNSAGFFTWADPKRRDQQEDENRRLVDAAAEIGAGALCIITGGSAEQPDIATARRRIAEGLHVLDETAFQAGVHLGLEPIHPRDAPTKGCINSIAQSLDVIAPLKATGLILDLFHSWWDADLVATASRPDIRAVQVCNVAAEPKRSPDPEEGILNVAGIVRDIRAAGYRGVIEFEVFAADHGHSDVLPLLHRAAEWSRDAGI